MGRKQVRVGRRAFLANTAAAGAGVALAGVAPAFLRSARAQQATVRIFMVPEHKFKAYDALFAQFAKDKNVRVEPEYLQYPELRAKMLATAAGGDAPDVIWDFNWTQEMAKLGLLQSFTDYLKRDGAAIGFPSDWLQSAIDRQVYNNNLYGLQNFFTNECLFYNKKLLRDAGVQQPPTTWDEFLDAATKTTKHTGGTDVWGFVSVYRFLNGFLTWYFQGGARLYDPQANKMLTDSPDALAAFQFFHDLHWKYKVAPVPVVEAGVANPRKMFTSGRVAMIISGPWDLAPIRQEAGPDFEWGVSMPLKGKVRATLQAGTGVNIPKNAPNKDLGWELIKRILSLDTMRSLTKEADFLFARRSWASLPEVQNSPVLKVFSQARAYAVDWNAGLRLTGKGDIQTTMFQTLVDQVTFNLKPVPDAVGEFTAKANAELRQG